MIRDVEGVALIVTAKSPDGLVHGRRHTYLKGCRCTACTTTASDYKQAWRERTGKR